MSHSSASHDTHDDAMHASHGSLKSYLTGFVLAAILTIIPFWLVMGNVIDNREAAIFVILALAVAQIVVHMIYFLHLDTRSEGGWNMLAFLFTAILVLIVLGASIWVMFEENSLMMPTMDQQTHQQSMEH